MIALARLTVPDLRARCRALGLPAYQSAGRRLRKADLVAQLEGHGRPTREERPRRPVRSPRRKTTSESSRTPIEPYAASEPLPRHVLEYLALERHARALRVSLDELRERDRITMRRIMTATDTPADSRHWAVRAALALEVQSERDRQAVSH